jgi:hypothetical protein
VHDPGHRYRGEIISIHPVLGGLVLSLQDEVVENDSKIKVFKDDFKAVLVFRDKTPNIAKPRKTPFEDSNGVLRNNTQGFIASLSTSFSRSISTPTGCLRIPRQ